MGLKRKSLKSSIKKNTFENAKPPFQSGGKNGFLYDLFELVVLMMTKN